MKSIVIALIVTCFTVSLQAQTIDDIKDLVGKNQWDKAKEQVDKYLTNDKNTKTGEGWYMKAYIYNNIARDTALSPRFPNAREEAAEVKQQSYNNIGNDRLPADILLFLSLCSN